MQTFVYDIESSVLENGQEGKGTVYIVQQHCNRGTLIDAGGTARIPYVRTAKASSAGQRCVASQQFLP